MTHLYCAPVPQLLLHQKIFYVLCTNATQAAIKYKATDFTQIYLKKSNMPEWIAVKIYTE